MLNSSWSNDKSKGQTLLKIDKSDIHGKLIEQGVQWNQILLIWT